MNEININALSRSVRIDKAPGSANPKRVNVNQSGTESDSVQFHELPDLANVEKGLEEHFSALRSNLEEKATTENYPPLKTIDRLAHMLAITLDSQTNAPLE